MSLEGKKRKITIADFPLTISQSGHYRLVENIPTSGPITITGTSVTFDFNGYTLSNNTFISIQHAHQLYLKNGTIHGGKILLQNCTHLRISRMNLESVEIMGDNINEIYLSKLRMTEIIQNGIELTCNNGCIKDCTISRSARNQICGSGIKLYESHTVIIMNNVVTGFKLGISRFDADGAGIVLVKCSHCLVKDNTLIGNNFGIKNQPVEDNTFLSNIAINNEIDNYIGLNPFLIAVPSTSIGSWINISN